MIAENNVNETKPTLLVSSLCISVTDIEDIYYSAVRCNCILKKCGREEERKERKFNFKINILILSALL